MEPQGINDRLQQEASPDSFVQPVRRNCIMELPLLNNDDPESFVSSAADWQPAEALQGGQRSVVEATAIHGMSYLPRESSTDAGTDTLFQPAPEGQHAGPPQRGPRSVGRRMRSLPQEDNMDVPADSFFQQALEGFGECGSDTDEPPTGLRLMWLLSEEGNVGLPWSQRQRQPAQGAPEASPSSSSA
mmetsp:Transcript_48755/g.109672  ORF Transcript_48755/g.109672 Transcript_48755/m.109672 type:complete len:187 (+) Transcript_48755:85-645(+)